MRRMFSVMALQAVGDKDARLQTQARLMMTAEGTCLDIYKPVFHSHGSVTQKGDFSQEASNGMQAETTDR